MLGRQLKIAQHHWARPNCVQEQIWYRWSGEIGDQRAVAGHDLALEKRQKHVEALKIVENDEIGLVAGRHGPDPIEPPVVGHIPSCHPNRSERIEPGPDRFSERIVEMTAILQVVTVAVIRAEAAP